MSPEQRAHWLLRIGVGFAFIYPAYNAYFEPYSWLGYVPSFARGFVDDLLLLHAFGALEIALALWILSGWRIRYPAFAAAAILVVIVVLNPHEFPILFRDLSIAAAALALAFWSPHPSRDASLQG
jgi:uncharacterized membrane protein YphA (DoxX/SURF4 family)